MNKISRLFFLCLLALFNPLPCLADPVTAFTLIGAPKYPHGFAHYDFVNPDAPKGGTVTYGVIGTFDSLQPWLIKGQPAAGLNLMYDTLMARSPDEPFTLYPLIARQVDWNKTAMTLTFDLDEKARFSDGHAITAEDVVFRLNSSKNLDGPTRGACTRWSIVQKSCRRNRSASSSRKVMIPNCQWCWQ